MQRGMFFYVLTEEEKKRKGSEGVMYLLFQGIATGPFNTMWQSAKVQLYPHAAPSLCSEIMPIIVFRLKNTLDR